jgi:shikimate dehydrogenase
VKGTPGRLVLLGHPVAHSLSPVFQNAALQAYDISLTYETLDVTPEALRGALDELRAVNAIGNVTIPHKEAVRWLCARVTPLAEKVGAVNVFWHEGGSLIGDNSDVGGAEVVIRALLGDRTAGAHVALVGAGGSAAALLCAAERCGAARVTIYNRNRDRAELLAGRFAPMAQAAPTLEDALAGATLVVNATPVGLHGDEFPVPLELLPPGCAVFDLTYRAGETPWITAAREAGHRAADGEGMLVEQGAIAFEMWFGIRPDRNVMWKAIH